MKTLLVTGGCGFIGSPVVHMLLKQTDWRVLNLDKLTNAGDLENLTDIKEGSRYHFVQGDISDATLVNRLFEEERPWAVVNFAAESHVDLSIVDPSPFLQTNTIGIHVDTGLREIVRWYIEHRDRLERVASKDYQAYYEAVYNRAWNRS